MIPTSQPLHRPWNVIADSAMNDRIVTALAADGYAIVPRFLPADVVRGLRDHARALDDQGLLVPAGIGRGARRTVRRDVRGDRIRWLGDAADARAERPLFEALAALRADVNRELTLGLVAFEGHYALYPAGSHYARHRDRFRDDDARVLSIVLYVNAPWRKADGGHLRIHVSDEHVRDVAPEGGTLVVFQSDRFEHEVLPAARERLSIAGWFRRRA